MNFNPFPVLETDRLILRQLTLEDTKAIFGLRTNKEINTFITRNIPNNLSETRAFIDMISALVEKNDGVFWVIEAKQSNYLIGTIGLRHFEVDENYAEVGYELHPDFQERGFMSEALQEVLKFGFNNLNLKTIEAFTHKNNMASIALLEKHQFVFQPERKCNSVEDNRIWKLENK